MNCTIVGERSTSLNLSKKKGFGNQFLLQPCIGQVLGDTFAEIESLGLPEHFCEDELLFILQAEKRLGGSSCF